MTDSSSLPTKVNDGRQDISLLQAMTRPIQILLLFILVVSAYLPALHTIAFIIDDYQLMAFTRELSEGSLYELFFSENTRYFRPVIHLSFLIDLYLWDLNPVMMRLVNIFIHATNTILVYMLAHTITDRQNEPDDTALLISAVFAIHPLHSEAVNWISGRTDPLASLFVLIGMIFFLRLLNRRDYSFAWFSAFFIFIGCMAKEVAVFVFPGVLLYLLIMKNPEDGPLSLRWRFMASRPYFTGLSIYLLLRSYCIHGIDQGIQKISGAQLNAVITIDDKTLNSFKAFGFYIKKLLFPMPLNFSIYQVSDYYLFIGLAGIVLTIWLTYRRNLVASMVLLIAATISPAVINAIYKIAWTPYAERYLYLPTALLLLAVYQGIITARHTKKYFTALLLVLFFCYLPVTIQRNKLWAKPLDLLEDSVSKSTNNIILRNNYAITLAANQHYEEARKQLNFVVKHHPNNYFAKAYLPQISLMQNNVARAKEELVIFFENEITPKNNLLKLMTDVNEKLIKQTNESETIRKELIQTYKSRYKHDGDPAHILRAAEHAKLNKNMQETRTLLEIVLKKAPKGSDLFEKAIHLSAPSSLL